MSCLLLCLALSPAPMGAEPGLLAAHSLGTESLTQWRLPARLREISGLALTQDGRLLAVSDEAAVVYELDVAAGRLMKAFAYGDPVLRGDFEGIAVLEERVYLLTSDGNLVHGREGADGERLPYSRTDTGLGRHCELEGLAQHAERRQLLLACKTPRQGGALDVPAIFAWSPGSRDPSPPAPIRLPLGEILPRIDSNRLNPSGVAVDPAGGHILLVASRQRALVELTADGRLVRVAGLAAARHRQPEGIEVTGDGRLLLADEGGGDKARLGIYARQGASQ